MLAGGSNGGWAYNTDVVFEMDEGLPAFGTVLFVFLGLGSKAAGDAVGSSLVDDGRNGAGAGFLMLNESRA